VLDTRPIYHQSDAAICGHVFASFLALVLLDELRRRMERRGFRYEWVRLRSDLDALEEIRLEAVGRTVLVRSVPRGTAGAALQAAGVALGPAVRFVEAEPNVVE